MQKYVSFYWPSFYQLGTQCSFVTSLSRGDLFLLHIYICRLGLDPSAEFVPFTFVTEFRKASSLIPKALIAENVLKKSRCYSNALAMTLILEFKCANLLMF